MSSLDNALRILRCFSEDRVVVGVSEVAEELSLPKSSVSRLMKAMAEASLLEHPRERRGYSPGPLAFRLGNLYRKSDRVLELVGEALARLVGEFGLTGYIGVLDRTDVVLVGVRQGSYPVRLVLPKGTRVPAHVTAVGLALLARLPDEVIAAMYPAEIRYSETDQVNSAEEIGEMVRAARREGCALVEGVTYRGFNAVGVAVASEDDGQTFGFSLSCPQEVQTPDIEARMRRRMIDEAMAIGAHVGDRYWLDRGAAISAATDIPHRRRTSSNRRAAGAAQLN